MISVPEFTPIKPTSNTTDYWIKVILGLCILIIAVDLSFIVFSKKTTPQKNTTEVTKNAVTVSGMFDINGYIPPEATIEIQARQIGESVFTTVAGPFLTTDTHTWSWSTATNDATYELKAVVMSNNAPVATSSVLAVSAPALNETLRVVSSLTAPAPTGGQTQTTTTSAISGKIDLNGYIPWGATISINAKKQGESKFSPVVQTIKASDGVTWNWNNPESGAVYELQATLLVNNTVVGTSPTLSTSAPAQNEVLVINSKAIAPQTKETISGTLNINGPVPNGGTITIAARKSGTPQFAPIKSGVSPVDGSSWSYPDAQAGISYDILAYLVVNGTNYTQSQLLVVTAPAQNEVLHINITSRPSAPPQNSITFNCPGKNNSNQWQVAIQYNQNNANPNAKAFIVQLGSNSGGSDLFSIQTAPNNPSQIQSYTSNFMLNEGQTYFVQYAYTTCQNCTDPGLYSQFSQPIPVRCVTQPTNTPSPSPTVTPIPTLLPTPTNTPIPTLSPTPTISPTATPKISQCNESCGGSGYTCANGLQCVSGEGIGSSVCRNPNCTDQTDCTCPPQSP